MAEVATHNAAVSLSRTPAPETPRHPPIGHHTGETLAETADLKALARLVLARDTRRDSNRDRVSGRPTETETPARQSAPVHCEVKEGETVAETPAVIAGPDLSGNQGVTAVSLSRVLGNETPETPWQEPFLPASVGVRTRAGDPVFQAPPSWGEAEEERAAIVEHDNIPRAWAKGFARLDPDRPPDNVPPKRWLTFVDDVGRFLDSPFCDIAAALGWGPLDLFGCDRDRPFARIDQCGLLWLLNGDKPTALTENTATIERRTSARHTYRRKPNEPDRVLAWQLAP